MRTQFAAEFARIRDFLGRFAADTQGTTAIEYTVMSGGIALAIIVAVNAVGGSTLAKHTSIAAAFNP